MSFKLTSYSEGDGYLDGDSFEFHYYYSMELRFPNSEVDHFAVSEVDTDIESSLESVLTSEIVRANPLGTVFNGHDSSTNKKFACIMQQAAGKIHQRWSEDDAHRISFRLARRIDNILSACCSISLNRGLGHSIDKCMEKLLGSSTTKCDMTEDQWRELAVDAVPSYILVEYFDNILQEKSIEALDLFQLTAEPRDKCVIKRVSIAKQPFTTWLKTVITAALQHYEFEHVGRITDLFVLDAIANASIKMIIEKATDTTQGQTADSGGRRRHYREADLSVLHLETEAQYVAV